MQIINKITKRDVTKYLIALLQNKITKEEFEEVTCTQSKK